MRMAVEKPNPPVFSYKFQGIFNFSVFSELTEHTESKFLQVDRCKVKTIFVKILHTVYKEVEMIDVHQNLMVALTNACEIS